MINEKVKVGYALTGSFCTFDRALDVAEALAATGKYELIPIMSETTAETDTRFGTAEAFKARFRQITGRAIIDSIVAAEPIGPQKLLDILVIAPCTGNTLGKLAGGIADSCVTMAAKAHLRNGRPLVLGISTNDGLSGNAANIGALLNRRNVYFIPFEQDDAIGKPSSLVAAYELAEPVIDAALERVQYQPLLFKP